jgi:hypothetical protein
MATPIDELVIQIRADTKQLQKDLDQIKGKLKTTGSSGAASFAGAGAGAGLLAGQLKRLAGPAAIGAVVLGFGKLVGFSARAGMEFEDLKDSLDTVFGSIEAGDKQFKRILNFAQTTPFQIDTVTKAFISLGSVGIEPTSRMMQVFADTASVAVDQRGAFEALIRVVQRAEAGALGLMELNMLADRGIDVFKGLKDELGLSRLELADFGQTADGAQIIVESLVNVLEKQFGGAMVAKMDNLSVAISNMNIAFKNLGNEIFMGPLGMALKFMVEQTSRVVNNMAIAMAEVRGAGLGISLEAPKLKTDMDFDAMQAERARAAKANIQAILDQIKLLADTSEDSAFKKFVDSIDLSSLKFGSLGMIKEFAAGLMAVGVSSEDAKKLTKNLNEELVNQREILQKATMTQEEINAERMESILIQGRMASVIGLVQKHQEDLLGNSKLLEFGQKRVNEIYEKYKLLLEEIGIMSATDLTKALDDMTSAANDNAKTFEEVLAPAIQQISLQFTNDFVNSLLEGQNALESFKNFAKNIVSQIISTFLQMAVVNEILMAIFGKTGLMPIKGFSVPTLSGAEAGGGTVQGGGAYLVGERGPELFVPNTGGTVMNNMNTNKAMGGGPPIVINQSVNFATGVVPTVRAEVTKMMPQIADVTKGAVAEAAMRGGNFRRALQGG